MKRRGNTRGFTLVEVMISAAVLAIGVLALAIVFPVVIRQQRLAYESFEGASGVQAAAATLRNRSDLDRAFWIRYRNEALGDNEEWFIDGVWHSPPVESDEGVLTLNANGPNGTEVELRQGARLTPLAGPRTDPRFVWDVAVRRVERGATGDLSDDGLQVAVFMRRIDRNIRLGADQTLFIALGGDPGVDPDLLAVAADNDDFPTNNGVGEKYSVPLVADMEFRYDDDNDELLDRDRLYISNRDEGTVEADEFWAFISVGGQQLIDNHGVAYTVVGAGGTGNDRFVRVSPPVASFIADENAGGGDDRKIRHVVFTPQRPVGVTLFEVTP